jgi:hypothetical protein
MIRLTFPKEKFDLLLDVLQDTGEFFLSRSQPRPDTDSIILFECEDGRLMNARVKRSCVNQAADSWLLDLKILTVYPYGLKAPGGSYLDANESADWLFIQADAFRVFAKRLEIPREVRTQMSHGVRYKFVYRSEDLWEAALKVRVQEHRLHRINEREKNFHFKGALTHA